MAAVVAAEDLNSMHKLNQDSIPAISHRHLAHALVVG
jgi:hypothetical protein